MSESPERKRVFYPPYRRVRVFAFDPILSQQIDTHDINVVTVKLPWDKAPENGLEPGPVDDYLEVVDRDPASQRFYAPVDLNDPLLLAQDGLPPSESNPQFHQQMVYAVARKTIKHFERALGRCALWSETSDYQFVRRLRIYPHALREANAYYSPAKKALLFGYFPASTSDPGENLPGGMVFTCLSHDIIAHEMSHALLDGLHPRFIEPSNVDVWAFHEAFADIVALFQHFSYPDVLRHQIARTRGDLEGQNILGELAYQFGQAIERYGALRSAIGHVDPETRQWIPEKPDPEKINTVTEPHQRGAILVAAVFDAFLTIYKRRIADLLRIATGGTGILPPGELHPDLVERLAGEAAKTASHVLNMCIRALDYCPPVDVDFGDFLRALITADFDLVTDDHFNYRLAFVEAFRSRGIYPRDVRSLSVESLLWHRPDGSDQAEFQKVFGKKQLSRLMPEWGLTTDLELIFNRARISQGKLHELIVLDEFNKAASLAKLVLDKDRPEAFFRGEDGLPTLEIHSMRPARRIGPEGHTRTELVVEMTQRRRGYYDAERQKEVDKGSGDIPKADFIYRGGCTLLINPESGEVRYCIYKRILSQNRLERMRKFLTGSDDPSLAANYFGNPYKTYFKDFATHRDDSQIDRRGEPFRILHHSFESEEEFDV